MRRRTLILGLAALSVSFAPASAEPPPPEAPTRQAMGFAPRPDINDPENLLYLDLSTGGRVTIFLRPDAAPAHVERVKLLARRGFYDGLVFHRVIEGFMAQTGDPQGTGEGGSELPDLKAEFNNLPHMRGAVSMARTEDPDSANSQFFITFAPVLRLDRQYTVFGRVIAGMEWVDTIPRGEPPATPARILQASIAADRKPPPAFAKPAANLPADLPPSALPPAPPPRP